MFFSNATRPTYNSRGRSAGRSNCLRKRAPSPRTKLIAGSPVGNTSIGVQDLAGVSIAAVKELDAQLQEKNAEIERLQNEIKQMKASQSELEKRLAAIEQSLKEQK